MEIREERLADNCHLRADCNHGDVSYLALSLA